MHPSRMIGTVLVSILGFSGRPFQSLAFLPLGPEPIRRSLPSQGAIVFFSILATDTPPISPSRMRAHPSPIAKSPLWQRLDGSRSVSAGTFRGSSPPVLPPQAVGHRATAD